MSQAAVPPRAPPTRRPSGRPATVTDADSGLESGSQSPEDMLDLTETAAPSPSARTTRARKKGRRVGAVNYSADDTEKLLDLVEEVQPMGAQQWAIVANEYAEYAQGEDRPKRDQDSLRNKFDKLVNAKKKTGDPTCPADVRRAKRIAKGILAKCAATTIGDS